MDDYEELLNRREADENIISRDGEYTIVIERKDNSGKMYWDSAAAYVHLGHILYLDNPKTGRFVRMPRGELYKIVRVGTERDVPLNRNKQIKAVYLREVV